MEIGIFFVGIFAGILSGLFGIGGGIVMVPILIAFFGMGMLDANATSLAAMLLPVGVFGVISYYKAGFINVKESLWISLGLFGGSFVGAELAVSVDVSLLSKLYAVFLLYVVISFFDIPSLISRFRNTPPPSKTTKQIQRSVLNLILLGVFAGVIAGMFGKGGGIIIVPILIKFFGYNTKAATATSLAALQLPVGLPSVIIYGQDGHLNLALAALMALGLVIGVFVGSKMALKISSKYFKKVYAVFLLGVAVYMVVKYI